MSVVRDTTCATVPTVTKDEASKVPTTMPVLSSKRSFEQVQKDYTSGSFKRLKDTEDLTGDHSENTLSEPSKKISFGLAQKSSSSKISFGGIKMGLQKPAPKMPPAGFGGGTPSMKTAPTKPKVAAAFGDDEDEEEEMPPEAKMRMRNIGRDTPTSAGPNSFGKSRMGFCDAKKLYERKLKETEEKLATDKE